MPALEWWHLPIRINSLPHVAPLAETGVVFGMAPFTASIDLRQLRHPSFTRIVKFETGHTKQVHIVSAEIEYRIHAVSTSPGAVACDILRITPASIRAEVFTDVLYHASVLATAYPTTDVGSGVIQMVIILGAR